MAIHLFYSPSGGHNTGIGLSDRVKRKPQIRLNKYNIKHKWYKHEQLIFQCMLDESDFMATVTFTEEIATIFKQLPDIVASIKPDATPDESW